MTSATTAFDSVDTWPTCSVIVPIRNEGPHLQGFIQSVERLDYPEEALEVIIIDGMSTDGTYERLAEWSEGCHRAIVLLRNERRHVPFALNLAIRRARGEYIVRLDAHTEYPDGYVKQCVRLGVTTGADNVGGVVRAAVLGEGHKVTAIRALSQSILGVGNSRFRMSGGEPGPAETVPFGCFTRRCFEKYGLFNEYLVRAQDLEFNKRVRRLGGEIYMDPSIVSTYYNRGSLGGIARKNFNSGRWTWVFPYVSIVRPSLRHTLPMVFVAGVAGLGVLSLWSSWVRMLFMSLGVFYALTLILGALRREKLRNPAVVTWFVLGCAVSHFTYGLGSLVGLLLTGPRCGRHRRAESARKRASDS